ncbi:MAG: hypothetical protein HOK21_19965 [Rhodospirillaceae bacterium]|nr:hypothetical protein [Rhodospirillaceae bacterium]MBT5881321.1 hypothetical protein [Rhodospirillaceae bacterium]
MLLLGIGGCAFPQAPSTEPLSKEQLTEIDKRRHAFILKGEMIFEGERVLFDDMILCGPRMVTRGTWPRRGINFGPSLSRISRKLKGGGALHVRVPSACQLWRDIWELPKGAKKPHGERYFEYMLRPPDNFLPFVAWTDNWQGPEVAQIFASEGYYDQPKARLKILNFAIEQGPYPLDAAAEQRIERDFQANRKIKFYPPIPKPKTDPQGLEYRRIRAEHAYDGRYLIPMYEAEWRQAPLIAAFINALPPGDELVQLPAATFTPKDFKPKGSRRTMTQLQGRTWQRSQLWLNAYRKGIPQRGERHGLLYTKRNRADVGDPTLGGPGAKLLRVADDLIPLDCKFGVCSARFEQQGSFLFRPRNKARKAHGREPSFFRNRTLVFDGRTIPYLVQFKNQEKKIAKARAFYASPKAWKLTEERKKWELFFVDKGHSVVYDQRRRTIFRINQSDMKF